MQNPNQSPRLTVQEIRDGCIHSHEGDENEIRICAMEEEFRQGLDIIKDVDRAVTIFGSARTDVSSPYYEKAKRLADRIVKEAQCAVLTGGGPGIMQGANEGAHNAGGDSFGFTIKLPSEQHTNPFVTREIPFYYFFTRKVAMTFTADAFLVFPGGFGTLDEAFEVTTLMQTGKIPAVPMIFVGVDFWSPLFDFIKAKMLGEEKTISPKDMDLIILTDDEDLIIKTIQSAPFYKK
ncbi:MAG: TIGR00730 family Rossman fold protein [Candidatus Pacebacteria bacterium]|nr:TIGR00730 family Rossman fold protein [Candidatus Paceibacterota bacterium]MCF7862567.1 TIGR00730 family Rossman fold protein [Candidatus Paceibacterota bacterium]